MVYQLIVLRTYQYQEGVLKCQNMMVGCRYLFYILHTPSWLLYLVRVFRHKFQSLTFFPSSPAVDSTVHLYQKYFVSTYAYVRFYI